MAPAVAPYGTWESPISADIFAASSVELNEVVVNEKSGKIYLLEVRPAEGGRAAVIEFDSATGASRDVLPSKYNALTHVHEYGGAAIQTSLADGKLIFADSTTKAVFSLDVETGEATALVPDDPKIRFADFSVHPSDPQWIIAIEEDHRKYPDVVNTLVAINGSQRKVYTLASGQDFYSYPRFSHDGTKICWKQWSHPDMPWTGNELYIADWNDGKISYISLVAGKADEESVSQPTWAPDGSLFFADDKTDFYQLYRLEPGSKEATHINLEGLEDAEFAGPEWWLGSATYAHMSDGSILASVNQNGSCRLIIIDVTKSSFVDPGFQLNDITFNALKRISPTTAVVIGATATAPKSLFYLDLSDSKTSLLRASAPLDIPETAFSRAQGITYPRIYGPGGGVAHGVYLPPTNPAFTAPPDTLPPLIVAFHGGPTWQMGSGLLLRDQYWTSRGYALVQINYVGSTGYGRAYTKLLNAEWGVSDIADGASCIDYLANQGLIDRNRVGITGGSAGGYATLQALCTYPKIFAAGVSEYGISDMQGMFDDTHKFESQYLYALCFPPGTSEADKRRITRERSPLHLADQIEASLLLLQGDADMIVPVNQAEMIEKIVTEKGGDVKMVIYPGEGHIFHDGANVKDSVLQAEHWWQRTLLKGVV